MGVQAIPSTVCRGVCRLCQRERTCCAEIVLRGKVWSIVACAACRLNREGYWKPVKPMEELVVLPEDEPEARRLGKGLKARSPSKHSMPFTF